MLLFISGPWSDRNSYSFFSLSLFSSPVLLFWKKYWQFFIYFSPTIPTKDLVVNSVSSCFIFTDEVTTLKDFTFTDTFSGIIASTGLYIYSFICLSWDHAEDSCQQPPPCADWQGIPMEGWSLWLWPCGEMAGGAWSFSKKQHISLFKHQVLFLLSIAYVRNKTWYLCCVRKCCTDLFLSLGAFWWICPPPCEAVASNG